jgi:hypothetical protein
MSKYANHLPLYRQAQIFSRQGLPLDRSTLAAWVGPAAAELKPLYERLVAILKGMDKLFADETRCPVLDPGRGKTKPGYFWALACDDRPWGSSTPPAVIYSYAPGRGGAHAQTILRNRRQRSAPIAQNALERIQKLYKIEEDIRGRPPEE